MKNALIIATMIFLASCSSLENQDRREHESAYMNYERSR